MSKILPPLGSDKGIKNKEYITPETVQDAMTCNHKFSMKGSRVMQCDECGWGIQINSFEEFENITDYYGRRAAEA